YVATLDLPFAYRDVFCHYRDGDLFLALNTPWARSFVLHMCRGAHLLLGAARRGNRARRRGRRDGIGVIAAPALFPPLRATLMDIDRVEASENLHTALSPVIAALNHHECAASPCPLSIGVGFIIRDTEVCKCINQVCSLVC